MKTSHVVGALLLLGGASQAYALPPDVTKLLPEGEAEPGTAELIAPLQPAIAWLEDEEKPLARALFQDIEVHGAFPAAFSLRSLPAAPDGAFRDWYGVQAAWGLVVATVAGHPVEAIYADQTFGGSCWGDAPCEKAAIWCRAADACYKEKLLCPAHNTGNYEHCTVLSREGDPSFRDTPLSLIKGTVDQVMVVATKSGAPAHSPFAAMFNQGQAIPAGVHTVVSRPYTEAELLQVRPCQERASKQAVEAYNARYGTTFANSEALHKTASHVGSNAYLKLFAEIGAREGCALMTEHVSLVSPGVLAEKTLSVRIFPPLLP